MQSAHPAHGVLWEGRSPIDDAPIAAIVTAASANVKTGPMSTVWILRTDMPPNEAKRRGLDVSVCGHCPLRDGCYVNTFHAPRSVYDVYKADRYSRISSSAFDGVAIRWGGYGDPAVLPAELVHECNARARMWTGYTHQFKAPWAAWTRGVFMASVETVDQEEKLRALGWGTFRAGLRDGSDRGSTELCAFKRTGTQCIDCQLCDGAPRAIYIPAHGPRVAQVPAERLRLKQLRKVGVRFTEACSDATS